MVPRKVLPATSGQASKQWSERSRPVGRSVGRLFDRSRCKSHHRQTHTTTQGHPRNNMHACMRAPTQCCCSCVSMSTYIPSATNHSINPLSHQHCTCVCACLRGVDGRSFDVVVWVAVVECKECATHVFLQRAVRLKFRLSAAFARHGMQAVGTEGGNRLKCTGSALNAPAKQRDAKKPTKRRQKYTDRTMKPRLINNPPKNEVRTTTDDKHVPAGNNANASSLSTRLLAT